MTPGRSGAAAYAGANTASVDVDGISANIRGRLSAYLDLLAKWNRVYNLTAIRDRAQMDVQHVNDALAVLPYLPHEPNSRVLDVGSGGGVPGIPIAIARPKLQVTLLDSNRKKVAFLTQAAIELQLSNVRAIASRIEDLPQSESFDVVISRAFSDLSTFANLAAPHVAHDGLLMAMKGALPNDEIAALPPNVLVLRTPRLHVPGLAAERHLVVMRVNAGGKR
jgi:16S rRNA (guanine527-N7)-methyltransferase